MVKPFVMQRGKSAGARSTSTSLASRGTSLITVDEKTKEKIWDSIKMVVVAIPPLAAVIYLSVMMINQVSQALSTTNNLTEYMSQAILLNQLVIALQLERGMTCVYLTRLEIGFEDSTTQNSVMAQVQSYRNQTDGVIDQMQSIWTRLIQDSGNLHNASTFQTVLENHRDSVGATITTVQQNIDFYTPFIQILIYNTGRVFYDSNEGQFWGAFDALRMLQNAREMMGLKRALGGSFFAQGYLAPNIYTFFIESSGAGDRYLQVAKQSDPDVSNFLDQAMNNASALTNIINEMTEQIISNETSNSTEAKSSMAVYWFNNLTIFSNLIISSTNDLINAKLTKILAGDKSSSYTLLYTAIATVTASLVICTPVVAYLTIQTQRMNRKIKEKMDELNAEKMRSERLLFSMLPKSVAKALKLGQVILPKTYNEATVYFSDIKGFTTICSTSTPLEVVTLLNELYTTMDNVLDNYNCYKVETIGDAYMVVSGIPKANGYDHSNEICTMALHMLKEVSMMVVPHRPSEKLKMRIGINSGMAAAGIVGLKMPRYCLFGDTVNTASRMESTGLAMRIQISPNTANHLQQHFKGQFNIQERGALEIKGKGEMHTFWLVKRKGFPYAVDLSDADPYFATNHTAQIVEIENAQENVLY
ncbi:unnamed protein product, partial [Mesorhabditis belari]|uniref:guanylate cyclase n=1 Tax=Mesorhabditis belari TaxID=2138241 RepID=A0AAF3FAX7_9BILA